MPKRTMTTAPGSAMTAAAFNPTSDINLWRGRKLTREERRIADEARKEALVIQLKAQEAKLVQAKIGETYAFGSMVFDQTVSQIVAMREAAHGSPTEPYINQFTTRQIEGLAQGLLAAEATAASAFGRELARNLHLEPEPLGFFERLFGES